MSSLDVGLLGHTHPVLQRSEVRPAAAVEGDDLAVEHRVAAVDGVGEHLQLGVGDGDVDAVAAEQADGAVRDLGDRADAVPLHLERPLLGVAEHALGAGGGEHRRRQLRNATLPDRRAGPSDGFRFQSGPYSCTSSPLHEVDQPVVRRVAAAPAGVDQRVLAGAVLLAVEQCDDLLAVAPLLQLVGAGVPDRHLAAAVLAAPGWCPRTSRTPAGGPRSAPRGGCCLGSVGDARGHAPSSPARRRAPAGSPSAGAGRGAPG